ncbi:MAG: phage tail protein, partial [Plesiomonas sp.]
DADNPEQVKARARKQMSDARLSGYDLVAVVKGHRTASGQLWQPGQRVTVQSEPHGIDATYFVMGRELNGGRPEGKKTTLRLKEDGIWIPDAYATKNKNKTRKTKKSKEQVIIDVE